jgi:hypothetical protein
VQRVKAQIDRLELKTKARKSEEATRAHDCQFALNRDPGFASNSNPVMRGVR